MADFPISGTIDPQQFPFLLTDLHRNGATGSLKVEGPTYQKALYFRGGRVLFGSSNDPRDQLGAILIENGRITPEQLEDVNSKVGPGRPLAKVLSESGLVSQQELSEAAQIKVERILWDILTYTAGSFEFEDGVLPKGAVDLKLSTERLILAAVRRVTDRSFVLRHLGSLEVILRPTSEMTARLHEVQSDAGGLAEQIDGSRTLKDAASMTRLDEFEAAKIACGLLILGLVERTQGVPAAPADDGDEQSPFIIPDADDGDDAGIDLGQTAADSMANAVPMPAADESNDSPFFVPEGFSAPPVAPPIAVEPEPEEPTMMLSSPPAFAPAPEPEIFIPPPPPVSRPASSPGMLPLIPPPPRRPDPPQWTPPPALEPEPEPEPETIITDEEPATSSVPPSKEDLAALDALLNPHTSAASMSSVPMDRSGDNWEPKFSSLAGGGRRQPEGTGSLKKIVLGLALVVVIAGVGGAGWYFMQGPPPSASRPPATPAPVRTSQPMPTAATATATSAALATPAPAATTEPARTAAPTAAKTVAPTAPPVRTAPPTPPPSSGGGIAEARSMLRSGRFQPAAAAFAAHLRRSPGTSTIQLMVACSEESVKKAVDNVPQDDLYIVPVDYKGRSCYKMGWGVYDNESRAAAALKSLPSYFHQPGVTPRVVPTANVLH